MNTMHEYSFLIEKLKQYKLIMQCVEKNSHMYKNIESSTHAMPRTGTHFL